MKTHFSNVAIRWTLIGGIALCTPWFVSHSNSPAGSDGGRAPAFRIGEVLNYRIDWQGHAGAAEAQLQIIDHGSFEGATAWHFRATVHTTQPVRGFYPMDDQIDSYAVPGSLASREYQERLKEFGELQTMVTAVGSPGDLPPKGPVVIVPAGTRDALSAVYFLRATDWSAIHERRAPVYDGQNVYEMLAEANGQRNVHLAWGDFQATEIDIRLLDRSKEIRGENFKLWLADDAERTPLVCEARLPVGMIKIELVRDSASKAHGGTLRTNPVADSSHRAEN